MSTFSNINDVAVISAFGRGDLLATELKTRGMKVALIDVTESLGERDLADVEGPFALVRPTPLLPSHLEWLMTHSYPEIPQGSCLWLRRGPIEMRGPLAGFYAAAHPEVSLFRDYFAAWLELSGRRGDISKKIARREFKDIWMVQFAHSLACHQFLPSVEASRIGEPFPLNQTAQNPLFEADIFSHTFEVAKSTGVTAVRSEGVSDIQFVKNRMTDIEFILGRKEVLSAKSWVWCLSGEETRLMSETVAEKLFPRGVAEAGWSWRRFRASFAHAKMNVTKWSEQIPGHTLLIDDIYLPWTHENLVILKHRADGKTVDQWDVWVRMPRSMSRNPASMQKISTRLTEILKQRIPHLQMELELPFEEEAPLYPVFEPQNLSRSSFPPFINFVLEAQETIPRLDWAGRFQKQVETLNRIQDIKRQFEAAQPPLSLEGEGHDSTLHTP